MLLRFFSDIDYTFKEVEDVKTFLKYLDAYAAAEPVAAIPTGGVLIVSRNKEFCDGVATEKWIMDKGMLRIEGESVAKEEEEQAGNRQQEDINTEEVLQRFRVTFTTRLESDAEPLLAEDAVVPLHWRRLLEFYDHRETRIRATAQVAFAGVVNSHRAQRKLTELLSWACDRWWLQLSPKDADAHNEGVIDPQAFLELSCPVRRRIRAKRALVRVEQRFGNQLVEFERNMAERAWQEVGASERSIEFLCRCARQCLARIDRETTRMSVAKVFAVAPVRPGGNAATKSPSKKPSKLTSRRPTKESSAEFQKAQPATFLKVLKEVHIVIYTAAIPGWRSPLLFTSYAVAAMRAGTTIVGLATLGGGNCELGRKGESMDYF